MSESTEAYQQLFEEIRHLHNRLRWLGDHVHSGDGLTSATRSLMLSLYRQGPQTVPDMARERLVSRQIIQTQINVLMDAGRVKTLPNPRHKRSVLITLSSKGKRLIASTLERENQMTEQVGSPLTVSNLQQLCTSLQTVRQHLEGADAQVWEN